MNNHHYRYYPDIHILLIAIPLISAYNYHLTYSNIQFNWYYLMRYAIDTVQGYLAWYACRMYILYLDEKMPYNIGGARRLVWQLISTIFIGLFIICSTTEILSILIKGEWCPVTFYLYDVPIISIWFIAINGLYVIIHYLNKAKTLEQKLKANIGKSIVRHRPMQLLFHKGKSQVLLALEDIKGFTIQKDYVLAYDGKGCTYIQDGSLDKMEKQLPTQEFFRINRQFILQRSAIEGFRKESNGRLEILLKPHDSLPSTLFMSRTKAPIFKKWILQKDHQLNSIKMTERDPEFEPQLNG